MIKFILQINLKGKRMLKKIGMSLATMTLIGCGGGGNSSLPAIDNSQVDGVEVVAGYYAGENVLFAGEKIVGNWFLFQENSQSSISARFYDDGDARIDGSDYRYGVSKDGKEIQASWLTTVLIKYQSTLSKYLEVVDINGVTSRYDCYSVEYTNNFGIYDLIMCPN